MSFANILVFYVVSIIKYDRLLLLKYGKPGRGKYTITLITTQIFPWQDDNYSYLISTCIIRDRLHLLYININFDSYTYINRN